MANLRQWSSILFTAFLAMSVVAIAGPAQAGEVCPKNLVLPTPKSVGLGANWEGSWALNNKSKRVKPKSCRYAATCPMVFWNKKNKDQSATSFMVTTFRTTKKVGKKLIADLRDTGKQPGVKLREVRRGKIVTFAVTSNYLSVRAVDSISVYGEQRFASISMMGVGKGARQDLKSFPLRSMIKKTQRMANPCSGRFAKMPALEPLQRKQGKAPRAFGAWSLIR